jgi:hypothetical protein
VQRRGNAPERPRGIGVEGQRPEVSLGVLEVRLTRRALLSSDATQCPGPQADRD